MKSAVFRFAAVLCLVLAALPAASAEIHRPGRIILYSYYRQVGWGDRVQAGCLDSQGQIFTLEGHDAALHWPYRTEEQLARFTSDPHLAYGGTISRSDLSAIKTLIEGTEDQGTESWSAACDAGTEFTYAVTYSDSREPVPILLGMSGDSAFENTDPDAQSLYWCARQLFPQVLCYAYSDINMGPKGFTPVPLTVFLGIPEDILHEAPLVCWENDCEEGPLPVEMTEQDVSELRSALEHRKVIRKAAGYSMTGGYVTCCLTDSEGKPLYSINLYEGMLLLHDDGLYLLSDE